MIEYESFRHRKLMEIAVLYIISTLANKMNCPLQNYVVCPLRLLSCSNNYMVTLGENKRIIVLNFDDLLFGLIIFRWLYLSVIIYPCNPKISSRGLKESVTQRAICIIIDIVVK